MLRTAPSPFGVHTGHNAAPCAAPRPPVVHAGATNSNHHLARRASSSLQRQMSGLQSQGTLPMPRQRSSRCCAIPEALDLVSSASAAVSSFDDVCEAFGDIAKLDNVLPRGAGSSAAAAAAAALNNLQAPPLSPAAAAAGVGFDPSVALSWGLEKLVASLGSLSLLEGLVDKTLIDLFQQVFSALELAGSTFDTPWLRLGVAVAVAVAVRQAAVSYKAAHPQQLQRQLSPAASLSDAIAEQAAAAVLSVAGIKAPQDNAHSGGGADTTTTAKQLAKQQQQQKQVSKQPTVDRKQQASSSSSSSTAALPLPGLKAPAGVLPKGVPTTLLALPTLLLLGQVKRANKIKKQAAAVAADAAGGRWSPAALMVLIEGAALLHNYSEMASGVATLLHIAA